MSKINLIPELEEQKDRIYIESECCVALLARHPHTTGHTVVMPYRKVPVLEDLSAGEILDIMNVIIECKKRLNKAFGYNTFVVSLNQGYPVQSVYHLHWHVIPLVPDSHFAKYYAGISEAVEKSEDKINFKKILKEMKNGNV